MARRTTLLAIALAAVLGGTACIGATPRPDFEDVLRARGGGLVDELALEAVEVVRTRLGSPLDIRGLGIDPLDARVHLDVVVARDGATDRYVVRAGEVVQVDPVRLSASAQDLPPFPVADLPLERVEEMGDGARAALGFDDSWVESVQVIVLPGGEVRFVFRIESPRAYGSATFDGDANLVEAARG